MYRKVGENQLYIINIIRAQDLDYFLTINE